MKPFTKIAPYYDLLMKRVDYPGWVRYLHQIFERFGIKPRKILDLACGTGIPSLLLARQGYEVIGLDNSEEMLKVAMQNAELGDSPKKEINLLSRFQNLNSEIGRVRFIQADMRNFEIPEKVDVVISLFDSFNYLLTEKDLHKAYVSTYRALRKGGYFLFDMNTDFGLSQYWVNGTEIREIDGLLSIWRNSYDEKRKIARLDLTLFVPSPPLRKGDKSPSTPPLSKGDSGGFYYQRIDEVHEERGYSTLEIENLLHDAGFGEVHLYRHLQFTPPLRSTNRVMVVAKKSG